jgi:predicted nuclease with TOPRIM domain
MREDRYGQDDLREANRRNTRLVERCDQLAAEVEDYREALRAANDASARQQGRCEQLEAHANELAMEGGRRIGELEQRCEQLEIENDSLRQIAIKAISACPWEIARPLADRYWALASGGDQR